MHDAELDIGFGINAGDGLGQALETVAAKDQDVGNATGLEIVEDLEPESGALGFLDPKA